MKKSLAIVVSSLVSLLSSSRDRKGGGRVPFPRRLGLESLENRNLLSVAPFANSPITSDGAAHEYACEAPEFVDDALAFCPASLDESAEFFEESSTWDEFEGNSSFNGQGALARIRALEYGSQTYDQYLACAELDQNEEGFDEDEDGAGCDDGCNYACENKIQYATLGTGDGMVCACRDGSCKDQGATELVVLQEYGGTVTIPTSVHASFSDGYRFATVISNPGTCWNKTISINNFDSFTWTKPSNVSNSAAQRDFTFNFLVYADANGNEKYDAGETIADSVSLTVHIAWVELQISIAGEEYKLFTDLNTTLIAGQKIEAKIVLDSRLSIQENKSLTWQVASDDQNHVKSYTVNDSQGVVEYLTEADLHASVLKYYEIRSGSSSISCTAPLQWTPTGSQETLVGSYNEDIVLTVITPASNMDIVIQGNTALEHIDSDNSEDSDCAEVTSPLFVIRGTVGPVARASGQYDQGLVNFLQTVTDLSTRTSSQNQLSTFGQCYGEEVLDTCFPYGIPRHDEDGTISAESRFPRAWRLSDQIVRPTTGDQPFEPLSYDEVSSWDLVSTDERFTTSLIYKPDGVDSIWIPLKRFNWSWKVCCQYTNNGDQDSDKQWTIVSSPEALASAVAGPYLLQTWTQSRSNHGWLYEYEGE